jgi:peroxiredoxin
MGSNINFIRNTLFYRREFNQWQQKFDALAPKAGDRAPDFELGMMDGGKRVRLSDFQGVMPVALIFGSFT